MVKTIHGVRASRELVLELSRLWFNEDNYTLEDFAQELRPFSDLREVTEETIRVLAPLVLSAAGHGPEVAAELGDRAVLVVGADVLGKARALAAAWHVDEDPDAEGVIDGVLREVLGKALGELVVEK